MIINFCAFLIVMNAVLLFRLATRNDRLQRWQLRLVTRWLVRVARRNVALRVKMAQNAQESR